MARCKGYSRLRRLASSATAAPRQYPPHTSRLKTAHRAVFYAAHPLRVRIPLSIKIKATPMVLLLLGALQGIRTPDLLVRSQTLYPTELAAHFLRLPNYHTTTFRKNQPLFLIFFIFFKTVQNKKMSRYFLLSHIEKLSSPAIIIWSVISISSGISIARTAFVACTSANEGTAKP